MLKTCPVFLKVQLWVQLKKLSGSFPPTFFSIENCVPLKAVGTTAIRRIRIDFTEPASGPILNRYSKKLLGIIHVKNKK